MKTAKKVIIVMIVCIAAVVTAVCGWYFGYKVPHNKAISDFIETTAGYNEAIMPYNVSVDAYNVKVNEISTANAEVDEAINEAQKLLNSGETPYEPETIDALSDSISATRQAMISVPEKQEILETYTVTEDDEKLSKAELEAKTEEFSEKTISIQEQQKELELKISSLSVPDYSLQLDDLRKKQAELEDSISIQKQITCPEESFVIARLQEIEDIVEIDAVTEEHDPNGHLNKPGGYTSTVYFSVIEINQSEIYGDDLIDKGTDAGGAVETFASVEDAESRNDYLAAFDGGILASGSHKVLGTMVLRTSDKLTASQQKELEEKMIAVLTYLK